MIGLIVGIFIGTCLGFCIAALLTLAGDRY
jgi:hypothetical protein